MLKKESTIEAIYLLDYTPPQVAKLSETLDMENFDLSVVSSLLDATHQALDDAVLLHVAANWVLELFDDCVNLEQAIGTKISHEDIESFQVEVTKPFISHLRATFSVVSVFLVMFCQL